MIATKTTPQLGIPIDIFCQECGYNLRGLTSDRCPECGQSLGAVRSLETRIPWAHAEKLGRFRAFWKTVLYTSFKYKRFCEEIARPVSYRKAQRFRWMAILHVYVPILIITIGWYFIRWPTLSSDPWINTQLLRFWPTVLIHAAILAFLLAMTGLPSYFFEDRRLPVQQRNRGIAMSYYCGGVLAWFPLVPLSFGLGTLLTGSPRAEMWGLGVQIFSVLLPLGIILAYLFDLVHTLRRVHPQRPGRAFALAVFTPALWVAVGLLIFVCLPVLVLDVWIIWFVL